MNWEDPTDLQGFRGGDLFGVIEKLESVVLSFLFNL